MREARWPRPTGSRHRSGQSSRVLGVATHARGARQVSVGAACELGVDGVEDNDDVREGRALRRNGREARACEEREIKRRVGREAPNLGVRRVPAIAAAASSAAGIWRRMQVRRLMPKQPARLRDCVTNCAADEMFVTARAQHEPVCPSAAVWRQARARHRAACSSALRERAHHSRAHSREGESSEGEGRQVRGCARAG